MFPEFFDEDKLILDFRYRKTFVSVMRFLTKIRSGTLRCLLKLVEPVIYGDASIRDRRDFLTKRDWKMA